MRYFLPTKPRHLNRAALHNVDHAVSAAHVDAIALAVEENIVRIAAGSLIGYYCRCPRSPKTALSLSPRADMRGPSHQRYSDDGER
jgi:hypothetical protein